jgi:hypothetical protein
VRSGAGADRRARRRTFGAGRGVREKRKPQKEEAEKARKANFSVPKPPFEKAASERKSAFFVFAALASRPRFRKSGARSRLSEDEALVQNRAFKTGAAKALPGSEGRADGGAPPRMFGAAPGPKDKRPPGSNPFVPDRPQ